MVGGGGEGGMKCTLFFLYLGFNLLNISKTAAPDSSVCGSSFVLFLFFVNQFSRSIMFSANFMK